MPRSSPYPYLFLSQLHKQVSIPSGRCSCDFQSHLLQQLYPSGSGVHCPQPLCSGSGKRAVLHWVMVESREAHIPKEWLLHMSFTEAEVCSSRVPVLLQAPPTNPCSVRQLPAELHQLSPYTLTSLQTTWQFPPYYPKPHGRKTPSLSDYPYFKCSAQNFLHDLVSGLMMCYFCPFPSIFYLF